MNPEQPSAPYGPASGSNPYEFITTGVKPPKRSGISGASNPFVMKLVLIIGGATILIIVVVLLVSFIFSGKTNLKDLVVLAETQQEIVRVASQDTEQDTDINVSGAAISTKLTILTHQQNMLTYLSTHRFKVTQKQLDLKKSTQTDKTLLEAKATSTFNTTFTQIMRGQLQDYAAALKKAYAGAASTKEKTLLATQYNQALMLLKQWPSN